MKVNLKICNLCGEVVGGFNRAKCQFCGSNDLDCQVVNFGFVLGSTTFFSKSSMVGVIKYKGSNHLLIRSKNGNCCDKNGGFFHYMCISDEDYAYFNKIIEFRISKKGEYLNSNK